MGEMMFIRRRMGVATIAGLFCLLTMETWPMDRVRSQEASGVSSGDGGASKEGVYAGLTLRGIGPALMSGRVGDIAVDPVKHSTRYVAAVSGGVWKTTNSGTTWAPIFDGYGSYSIGCVAVDPGNHLVVWVGTGEDNSSRSVGYGDRLYKSIDGGASFSKVGLERSEHIAKVLIDPRDSNVIYVAVQGPLWNPGGDRGLYRPRMGQDVEGRAGCQREHGCHRRRLRSAQPKRALCRGLSVALPCLDADRRWSRVGNLPINGWRPELAQNQQGAS